MWSSPTTSTPNTGSTRHVVRSDYLPHLVPKEDQDRLEALELEAGIPESRAFKFATSAMVKGVDHFRDRARRSNSRRVALNSPSSSATRSCSALESSPRFGWNRPVEEQGVETPVPRLHLQVDGPDCTRTRPACTALWGRYRQAAACAKSRSRRESSPPRRSPWHAGNTHDER